MFVIKDARREKHHQEKPQRLQKLRVRGHLGLNGTSNQLFIRGSQTVTKFSKNKVVTGEIPFFVIVPFYAHPSICLNIGF